MEFEIFYTMSSARIYAGGPSTFSDSFVMLLDALKVFE